MDDLELLWEFGRSGDHAAFSRVAERYVGLIYASALRQVRDPHVADDVTQAVLIVLMNKAARLPAGTVVPGWLVRVTRYAAMDATKMEARRRKHERRAAEMKNELHDLAAADEQDQPRWEEVAPLLDEALSNLRTADRDAIVLRYLLNKPIEEMAWAMRVSEEAARKRLSRAMARLRKVFNRNGVQAGEAALGVALAVNALQPSPPAAVVAMAKGLTLPGSGALVAPPSVIAHQAAKKMMWSRAKWYVTPAAAGAVIAMVLLLMVSTRRGADVKGPVARRTYDARAYERVAATQTRLIVAANRLDIAAVQEFLDAGDYINDYSRDGNNTTALMYAMARNEGDSGYDVVKLLLDRGADSSVKRGGRTALMEAAGKNSPKTVKLLIERGADVHARTARGETAMDRARASGNREIIAILQKAGG